MRLRPRKNAPEIQKMLREHQQADRSEYDLPDVVLRKQPVQHRRVNCDRSRNEADVIGNNGNQEADQKQHEEQLHAVGKDCSARAGETFAAAETHRHRKHVAEDARRARAYLRKRDERKEHRGSPHNEKCLENIEKGAECPYLLPVHDYGVRCSRVVGAGVTDVFPLKKPDQISGVYASEKISAYGAE